MSRVARLALAAVVAVAVAAGGYAVDAATRGEGRPETEVLGPGAVTVLVDVRHSRFVPDALTVRAGTEVRFVVVNDDPIAHELIVGGDDVHDRHRHGTEPAHGAVPGEVSVAPGAVADTTFRFDRIGTVMMACHLPGHLAYGMDGEITVVDI